MMRTKSREVLASILLLTIALSVGACKKKVKTFEKVSRQEFSKALDGIDVHADEIMVFEDNDPLSTVMDDHFGEGSKYALIAQKNGILFSYIEYSSADFAHYYIDSYFGDHNNLSRDKRKEECEIKLFDDYGYILIDFEKYGIQFYGGIYQKDNTVIVVSNDNSEHVYSDKALIDMFLDLINYPKP